MGLPARQDEPIYAFGEFELDVAERRLVAGETLIELEPKALEMLAVLVARSGRLVSRRELLEILWPDTFVEEGNINAYASVIRKSLGDSPKLSRFIETIPKAGYRFVGDVREFPRRDRAASTPGIRADQKIAAVDQSDDETAPPRSSGESTLMRYGVHVLGCSLIYAVLFVVALFVEVAYGYEQFGHLAWRLAPWIFVWTISTSVIALWADLWATRSGHSFGLLISVPVFIVAGLGLATGVGLWLPPEAITKASFQTYPAQAAFMKSAFYFVPLAILYVVLPLHLVATLDSEIRAGRSGQVIRLLSGGRPKPAPRGAVNLRVWWLAVLLVFVASLSLYGTAHMFDRLSPDLNATLFIRLYQFRLLLFFLLGTAGLLWFQLSVDRLRRESRATVR